MKDAGLKSTRANGLASHDPPARRMLLCVPHGVHMADAFLDGFARSRHGTVRILLHRDEPSPSDLRSWFAGQVDAVIAIDSPASTALRRIARRRGIPSVIVSFASDANSADLAIEESALGTLAADHLLARGVRRAAYVVSGSGGFLRGDGFLRHMRQHGAATAILRLPDGEPGRGAGIDAWLRQSRPGLGVFCYNDLLSYAVAERCAESGIQVGSELLLIGCDDHATLCQLSPVPLSSVHAPFGELGAMTWWMVSERLAGREVGPIRLPPGTVAVRASTDATLIGDPAVARALSAIADRRCETPPMERIAAIAGVSRRTLERRFRKALGRGVHAEIMRVRLERARDLLAIRELALQDIATRCGFADATGLHRAFRRLFGIAPGAWRNRYAIAASRA